MKQFRGVDFLSRKEAPCLEQELLGALAMFWIRQTTFNRTFDLAHRPLIKTDAFSTSLGIDDANRALGVFENGASRTSRFTCAAINTVCGDKKAHGQRL